MAPLQEGTEIHYSTRQSRDGSPLESGCINLTGRRKATGTHLRLLMAVVVDDDGGHLLRLCPVRVAVPMPVQRHIEGASQAHALWRHEAPVLRQAPPELRQPNAQFL